MNKPSEFPTYEQLDAMNMDELNELWKRLIDECDLREGAIACRALAIGHALEKAARRWMDADENKCVECGRFYTFTSDKDNPYWCPECDKERRERISASFEAIAAELDNWKAVKR